jgi:hypothetical protein
MTDGPEIPDARHVTDDERSDYDRHEDSNIYSTKQDLRRRETTNLRQRWTNTPIPPPIQRGTKRSGHRETYIKFLILPLLLFMHFHGVFPSLLYPFFCFHYIPSARKALLCLGHEREGDSFCFALMRRHMGRAFLVAKNVYSRTKTHLLSFMNQEFLHLLYRTAL